MMSACWTGAEGDRHAGRLELLLEELGDPGGAGSGVWLRVTDTGLPVSCWASWTSCLALDTLGTG